MSLLTSGLKLPLKIISWLMGGKRKVVPNVFSKRKPPKTDLEKKQLEHVWNFDPSRVKSRSWQQRVGKKMPPHQKKRYKSKQKNKSKKSI
ncbi:hypothetical protein [endosymbiont DhMRE of Dentiscutata heterogama]|uniref:hypothetical protein n=1 Tax=endosymbiont DhMRE of Dentiscutata heterogama TaxID=1609546 RepID=UPI002AD34809|nr:hypothetical protein [endosymbiont DhMRE of Dentiscutata heterogama]